MLAIVDAPLVSSDFNHNPASRPRADQTKVIDGTFVRV
jgi:glyceraldehyde 3-phosphate dehydrogenase